MRPSDRLYAGACVPRGAQHDEGQRRTASVHTTSSSDRVTWSALRTCVLFLASRLPHTVSIYICVLHLAPRLPHPVSIYTCVLHLAPRLPHSVSIYICVLHLAPPLPHSVSDHFRRVTFGWLGSLMVSVLDSGATLDYIYLSATSFLAFFLYPISVSRRSRPPFLSYLPSLPFLRLEDLAECISSTSVSGWNPAAERILGINLHLFDCLTTNNFLYLLKQCFRGIFV